MADTALLMATALVAHCEGCRLAPYQDVRGVWTVGYGATYTPLGVPITADTPPLTQSQAETWLQVIVARFLRDVRSAVTASLNDHQAAALTSFAYNEGIEAFRTSTMLRLLNAGDYAGAAAQFPIWNLAGGVVVEGLVNRRALEQAVFNGGDIPGYVAPAPAPATEQFVAPSAPAPKKQSFFSQFFNWIS